jgi:hypothetical protein
MRMSMIRGCGGGEEMNWLSVVIRELFQGECISLGKHGVFEAYDGNGICDCDFEQSRKESATVQARV